MRYTQEILSTRVHKLYRNVPKATKNKTKQNINSCSAVEIPSVKEIIKTSGFVAQKMKKKMSI